MLSDLEFVSLFSVEIGAEYKTAKSYVTDLPTQTLLQLRSLTHKLTDMLAAQSSMPSLSPNLYDRIESLNQQRVITVKVSRTLHRLRVDGNKGAHPEKFHLTQEQLVSLSEGAIKRFLSLIEMIFPLFHHGVVPAYTLEPFDLYVGRELCYRAVMEDDHQAQYFVGLSLKTKGLSLKNEGLLHSEQEQILSTELKNLACSSAAKLSQAEYWFATAAPYINEAKYEHGVALLHGYSGGTDKIAGEQLIAEAARDGDVNAQALLGFFYLTGSECYQVDCEQAHFYLKQAANAEHSEAMANLGVYYYQQGQLSLAVQWVTRAAQVGFPQAQYHLALFFLNGEGVERDTEQGAHWMREAAKQKQLDAMLTLAKQILHSDNVEVSELSLAETYLREVIKYSHSVPAMIELSVALADGILQRIALVESAQLLSMARAKASEHELTVIVPLWRSLRQQISQVIAITDSDDELLALKKALELLTEY